MFWRRGRDSNPRGRSLPPNDLANRPLQPLGYLSAAVKQYSRLDGGGGGIRTHGTVAGTTVFKTVSFNHSDTPPCPAITEVNYTILRLSTQKFVGKRFSFVLRTW